MIIRTPEDAASGRPILDFEYQCIPVAKHSVAYCIAAIIQEPSLSLYPLLPMCSGAPGPTCGARSEAFNDPPQCFRDFDRYELERDRDLFARFIDWKVEARELGLSSLPVVGDNMTLGDRNIIDVGHGGSAIWRMQSLVCNDPQWNLSRSTEAAVAAVQR